MKADAQAKAKAEAEAKAAAAAEVAAREQKKAQEQAELNELRRKRAEERAAHAHHAKTVKKEGVEYGKDRQSGIAGPDAAYILFTLERWSLRGPGYLK